MNTRKTHFEVIKQAEIPVPPIRGRILSLTFDPALSWTRELLFAGAGFQVVSFREVSAALAASVGDEFDLIVLGHSIPREQRQSLISDLRGKCSTPILALTRHGETPLVEAEYLFDSSQSPALLLETVIGILRPNHSSERPTTSAAE